MKKKIWFCINFTALLFAMVKNCYAYIDPATTSYLIQIIAGVIIAGGAAIGIAWNKLTRKIRKSKADNASDTSAVKPLASANEKKTITAEDLLGDEDEL